VIFRPNAQLSKHHPSERRELSIRTFLYVEKLRTGPGCIHPDVSQHGQMPFSVRQGK